MLRLLVLVERTMRGMVVSSLVMGGSVERKPPESSHPVSHQDDFLPRGTQCSEPDDNQQPQTSRQTINLPSKVLQISGDFHSGGENFNSSNISSCSLLWRIVWNKKKCNFLFRDRRESKYGNFPYVYLLFLINGRFET